jgi:hypothetical protein
MKNAINKFIVNSLVISAAMGLVSGVAHAEKIKKSTSKASTYESLSSDEGSYSDSVLPSFDNTIELELQGTSAGIVSASGTTSISLSLAAYYFYSQQIEIGGSFGMASAAGTSHMGIYGLGKYNFDTYLKKSFYAGGGIGFADPGYVGAGVSTDKKMSLVGFAGKRFPLWSRLMLSPEVRFEKIADVDPVISVVLFNISIVL